MRTSKPPLTLGLSYWRRRRGWPRGWLGGCKLGGRVRFGSWLRNTDRIRGGVCCRFGQVTFWRARLGQERREMRLGVADAARVSAPRVGTAGLGIRYLVRGDSGERFQVAGGNVIGGNLTKIGFW